MKKVGLVYFGSSYFSAIFLEKLLTDSVITQLIEIKFVVTQPDRKVGRKQILTPTPVKEVANRYKIPVFEVGSRKREAGQENGSKKLEKNLTSKFQNLDLALVFAYANLIPKELLALPKYGFWCVHPSLLPKYRGTSPMATALINGDETTGVTIFKMDEEIDHGPIIAQEKYTIKETDKRPDLEVKLTDLAFKMFKKLLGEKSKFFATWDAAEGGGPTGDKKFRYQAFNMIEL